MSMFGGRSQSDSERIRTKSYRASSPARTGANGHFVRPSNSQASSSRSQASFFSGGSSRGIFGGSGGSSYYKRRPRDNYVSMLWHKLQRMIRELWSYARRHPVKAFFAVVVPLLSAGGAISGLMHQFGFRIPGLTGMVRKMSGGYYGSQGYGDFGGGGGGGGGNDWMGSAGSMMQIAKAFM